MQKIFSIFLIIGLLSVWAGYYVRWASAKHHSANGNPDAKGSRKQFGRHTS